MRISPAGLQLIKSFEGFRETAVRLPDGRWTIGYGHVRTAREGLTITPKDADELLLYDLKSIENAVSNISVILTPIVDMTDMGIATPIGTLATTLTCPE